MMTPEQLSMALKDRRLAMVADATGLHYNTIRDIRDGRTTDPGWKTVKALSDHLQGTARKGAFDATS